MIRGILPPPALPVVVGPFAADGPNILRPMIQAPKPSAAGGEAIVSFALFADHGAKSRFGKNQPCNSWPRLPSGCSMLWSGPAPKPSMETAKPATRTLLSRGSDIKFGLPDCFHVQPVIRKGSGWPCACVDDVDPPWTSGRQANLTQEHNCPRRNLSCCQTLQVTCPHLHGLLLWIQVSFAEPWAESFLILASRMRRLEPVERLPRPSPLEVLSLKAL